MMTTSLRLTGYDLTDEGPGRTVNEDATLVREDLGLFAVADGAGGRGRGDVAANLVLRTLENYIGSTVRRSHERADYDALGTPEQARRLSAAIHRAHLNIRQVIAKDPDRRGMASTVTAALFSPRTGQIHIAHVGDSRCYRLRHGRLEQVTQDHTIANEILERKPETPDEVLEKLPRNSVVNAVGMDQDLRVSVKTLDLSAGDRFLLCTDGLTIAVDSATLWSTMRAIDPPSAISSELLNHALATRTPDNVAIVVFDCREEVVTEELDTRRYNEIPLPPPPSPLADPSDEPSSAELWGPELASSHAVEVVEEWEGELESEFPTVPLQDKDGNLLTEPPLTSDPAPDLDFPANEERGDDIDWVDSDEQAAVAIEEGDLAFEESDHPTTFAPTDPPSPREESGVAEIPEIDDEPTQLDIPLDLSLVSRKPPRSDES